MNSVNISIIGNSVWKMRGEVLKMLISLYSLSLSSPGCFYQKTKLIKEKFSYWTAHAHRKKELCFSGLVQSRLCGAAEVIVASGLISCSLSHVGVMCSCNVHLLHAERANKYQLSDGMSRLRHVGLNTATLADESESAAASLPHSQPSAPQLIYCWAAAGQNLLQKKLQRLSERQIPDAY